MTTTLVNRTHELTFLNSCLDQTIHTTTSTVVVVRGEAGIGKTQLLTSFAEAATLRFAATGLLAGYGQATMNSLGSDSFQAVRECLRSLASSAQRSGSRDTLNRLADSFRAHAPDWIESVPVVGNLLAAGIRTGQTMLASANQTLEMDSRLDQLSRFVEDLLAQGPLLLVLDDLHWADTATIDLLVTLALKVEGPLMLVLAYRPDDLQTEGADAHPLKRAMFRLRRYRSDCAELDLERLSGQHTELLVRQAAGDVILTGDQIHRIVSLSAGNPLFAESLLHVGGTATPNGQAGTPGQIKAVLEERLSYLTGDDQRLLEAAALIGYSFEVDYLAHLARVDVDEVYERLDVLLNEHSLVRPAEPRGDLDRYTIHHPLLAEVLRQRGAANGPRWRRLHQKLLEILGDEARWDDELHVRAVEIAVAAGNRVRACELALVASRRQFQIGAVSKAKQLAQVAADHAQNSPRILEAHELLAEYRCAEGDHIGAAQACAEALRWGQVHPLALDRELAVQLLWARNLRMTNNWTDCEALLADLVSRGGQSGARDIVADALMLQAEIALCGPMQDTARCVSLCDAVYGMTTDPELQARALGHRGLAHLAAYEPDAAEMWLNRAIEVARVKEHPYAEYEAVHWLSKKTMACLELDRAWQLLRELAHTSDASGVASQSPWHLRDSSRVLGLQGNLADSARTFARYFDAGTSLGRAATTLACQIRELEDLYGRAAADSMVETLGATAAGEMLDHELRTVLLNHLLALRNRSPVWSVVPFAVERLGASQAEAEAADAIFRFDVPDLSALRSGGRPGHDG